VGSCIRRGPCLCRRYSTGRSLNSHIPAITRKDRPSNPRQLVCQGCGHDVAMCSRKQSLNPPAERVSFLARPGRAVRAPGSAASADNLATLADAQQPRFSTCRRLTRHQSQPSCQVTATAERLSISHRGHKGGRRQHADPKDPRQSFGSLLVVYPFGEFIVIPFDPLVDASPLLASSMSRRSRGPRPLRSSANISGKYRSSLRRPCGTVMPRSSMSARS
jgi:hypothetical protein